MKIFFLILIIFASDVFPVNFDKAKNLFDSGYYSELIDYTGELEKGTGQNIEISLYRAIALFKVSKFRESRMLLDSITEVSNKAEIKDTALYYLAIIDIKDGLLVNSAVILSRLLNSSVDEISNNADLLLRSLIHYKLSKEEIEDITKSMVNKQILSYIEESQNSLKILAALPLTGVDKEEGQSILKGLEFGVNEFGNDEKNIILDVVNSESKISAMVSKVLKRLNSSNYNVVIGELRSDPTAALAGITGTLNLPLLSPTASANDITGISENIYQLNTTSYTLGRTIAEYAIDSLGYKTFAVLAPMNDDGNESVSGFTEKVIEKGCAIISTEWYFDHFNLNRQLQRIRERTLIIDSLDTEEYMSVDSIKVIPAGVVDAFFLPVPQSDIESVLSQVAYYNFDAKIIGTYGWDDLKMLKKLSGNADSLVFAKESTYDLNNNKYTDFVYKFNKRYGKNPNSLEIVGYSVMEMLLSLHKKYPDKTTSKILDDLKDFEAVSGEIRMNGSRSNQASDLFRYTEPGYLRNIPFVPRSDKDSLSLAKKYLNTASVYKKTNQDSLAIQNYILSLEEYSSVLDLPDSLFQRHSTTLQIKQKIADSYYEIKDYENALIFYEDMLDTDPEMKDNMFRSAVCRAYSEEDVDPALQFLYDFTEDEKYSSNAYYHIG
ncbi:MAG: ABC transporter substrate-binding protein, partial [Candidatus Delongbacteria bacterium]